MADDPEKRDEVYWRVENYLLVERNLAWLAPIMQRVFEGLEIVVAVWCATCPVRRGGRTCSKRNLCVSVLLFLP